MKKKIIGLALVIAMLVPVTACGKKATVDSLFKDSEKAVGKVDSFASEIVLDLDMSVEVDTVSLELKVGAEVEAEVTEDAMYMTGNVDIEIPMQGDQSLAYEMYAVMEDDAFSVYASDGSEWTKMVAEGEDNEAMTKLLEQSNPETFMNLLSDYADEFELEKKLDKVNKSDAYVLNGKIDGRMLIDSLKDSEIDVSVEEIEEMLQTLEDEGINLKDYEAEVTVWIDKKSSLPAKVEIDFAEMLAALLDDAMAIYGESMLPSDDSMEMNFNFDIKAASVTIIFSEFNKVDDIEVPKKVKEAAEEVSMEDSDILGYVDEYSTLM